MTELTFEHAANKTAATIYSGYELVSTTWPTDADAAIAKGWIATQGIYVQGEAATVVPPEYEFEFLDEVKDFTTLAHRLRQCLDDLEATLPDPWTSQQYGYITLVTEYVTRVETYAKKFA